MDIWTFTCLCKEITSGRIFCVELGRAGGRRWENVDKGSNRERRRWWGMRGAGFEHVRGLQMGRGMGGGGTETLYSAISFLVEIMWIRGNNVRGSMDIQARGDGGSSGPLLHLGVR